MEINVHLDANTIVLHRSMLEDNDKASIETRLHMKKIINKFYADYEENKYCDEEAIDILNEKLNYLEGEIKTICNKYGRLEFTLLYRRVPTSMFFDRFESSSTAINVQRICMLFILKYCKNLSDNIIWSEINGSYISWLNYDYNMFVDLSIFIMLCETYNLTLNHRRIIWKDGCIILLEDDIKIEMSKKLEEVINFYDKRLSFNNASIYSRTGLGSVIDLGIKPKLLYGIPYCYNKLEEKDSIVYHIKDNIYNLPKPNFYFDYSDAKEFIKILEIYKIDYEETHNNTIEELVTFIIIISNKITFDLITNPKYTIYQVTQRGLLFYILDDLKRDLGLVFKDCYKKIFSMEYKGDVSNIINHFFDTFLVTYDYEKYEIDMFSPYSAFYEYEKSIGIDLTYFIIMISEILRQINISSKTKEIKGLKYENNLYNFISNRLPSLEKLFKPNKKITLDEKDITDIDLSYIINDVGFIIECKGYAQTIKCILGEKKEVDYRWTDFDEFYIKLDDVCKILSDNPKGDNYEIPKKVKKIIPIICSSAVEFLFEIKSYLNPDIPNICTPLELLWLIIHFDTENIHSKTVYYNVNHNK